MGLDPITFEVVTSSFRTITELMGDTLKRVSRSPIIYDSIDFSNGLLDNRCQLFAQANNCPVHLGSLHFGAQASIERYGGRLDEGDIVVMNDPYMGGLHIPDMTFTMPIYYEGELLCYGTSRGHWTDLGGGAVGSRMPSAVHIAQEGLRLPPVKVYARGKVVEEIRDIIGSNTRVPLQNLGDLEAHRAALLIADREMNKVTRRYGIDVVRRCMEEYISYTERRTRAAILEIPDGVYKAMDYIDCDGVTSDPHYIHVTLTISGDEITVDFTGTDKMAKGGINYSYAGTHSAVYWALKFFLDQDAPANAGMYRPIKLVLPEGVFVNAKWPAPVHIANMVTSEKIADVIWQALAGAIGEKMVAMPYADSNGISIGGVSGDRSFVFLDLPPGGWGGTSEHDGMNATYCRQGNCMDLDIELAEILYPIRITRRELIQNSGGRGKFRGGLSLRVGFSPTEIDVAVSHTTNRTKEGPPGVFGGMHGRPGRSIKNYERDDSEVIGGWSEDGSWKICMFSNLPIKEGEDVTLELQGGGGWGDPFTRDPQRVIEDVLDGYVSLEAAERDYGIIIDRDTMRVDIEKTLARRKAPFSGKTKI